MTVRRALAVATHLLGVAAFAYPFVLHPGPSRAGLEHSADAPIVFSLFAALMVALAVSEVRARTMNAKHVALLGLLAGVNAMLRLPGSLAGANLMFVLPILCGYAFGPRFGFTLGASSIAVSALVTGGIGPWLPFEMFALGWLGAGAGMLAPLVRRRARGALAIGALAAYGWVAGLAYGALVNLWFWPFLAGDGAITWAPGIGAAETLRRYARFYLLTSLAWDSARAFANAALVAVFGRPVLRLLFRFRARLEAAWTPVSGSPQASTMEA